MVYIALFIYRNQFYNLYLKYIQFYSLFSYFFIWYNIIRSLGSLYCALEKKNVEIFINNIDFRALFSILASFFFSAILSPQKLLSWEQSRPVDWALFDYEHEMCSMNWLYANFCEDDAWVLCMHYPRIQLKYHNQLHLFYTSRARNQREAASFLTAQGKVIFVGSRLKCKEWEWCFGNGNDLTSSFLWLSQHPVFAQAYTSYYSYEDSLINFFHLYLLLYFYLYEEADDIVKLACV